MSLFLFLFLFSFPLILLARQLPIVLETPEPFWSVSNFYGQFPQVDTLEVLGYLQQQKIIG